MNNYSILIIEDEINIARFLELELKYEGYLVDKAFDGRTGLSMALSQDKHYDLIILDIMLPSLNGIEALRRIRQQSNIPIIMLTAKDETMDKVMGLDLGADDYITKPFAIEELLARLRVLLKRKNVNTSNENVLCVKQLILDNQKHTVTFDCDIIDLTKREFDLLMYLMKNKNIVLNRDNILEKVWGYDYLGDTNIVDVYIRYLRTKIDEKYNQKFIHTVRGVGYLLKDE